MNTGLYLFLWVVAAVLVTLLSALCMMFIWALCCSAFRRVRLYCQVRKELRRVLKQPVAFEQHSGETLTIKASSEVDQKTRIFSLEETFLTSKNYKVIFCITFMISILRTVLVVPFLLGWKLTRWEGNVAAVVLLIMELISGFIFVFIPIAFALVVRVIFTVLLSKKIDQLEQATWERTAAVYRQKST
ncbi:hypothetical protein [Bartonella kosoyi]|uniref:hypothetical protein n=1 Tax=Bartonella kosoyi TaxID=2133959 RepID=UPI001FCECF4B|nr:hypothetical protein [Bartonella kosoyi]